MTIRVRYAWPVETDSADRARKPDFLSPLSATSFLRWLLMLYDVRKWCKPQVNGGRCWCEAYTASLRMSPANPSYIPLWPRDAWRTLFVLRHLWSTPLQEPLLSPYYFHYKGYNVFIFSGDRYRYTPFWFGHTLGK